MRRLKSEFLLQFGLHRHGQTEQGDKARGVLLVVYLILPEGGEEFYFISGGLLEIQPHVVTVLSDTAQRAGDLDEAAALKAKEEAERAIADRTAGLEVAQAQAQLAQAVAQLAALERFRKQLKR